MLPYLVFVQTKMAQVRFMPSTSTDAIWLLRLVVFFLSLEMLLCYIFCLNKQSEAATNDFSVCIILSQGHIFIQQQRLS
jgi:hypothetical protein